MDKDGWQDFKPCYNSQRDDGLGQSGVAGASVQSALLKGKGTATSAEDEKEMISTPVLHRFHLVLFGETMAHYTAQADLEFIILLPQPPKGYSHGHVTLHLICSLLLPKTETKKQKHYPWLWHDFLVWLSLEKKQIDGRIWRMRIEWTKSRLWGILHGLRRQRAQSFKHSSLKRVGLTPISVVVHGCKF